MAPGHPRTNLFGPVFGLVFGLAFKDVERLARVDGRAESPGGIDLWSYTSSWFGCLRYRMEAIRGSGTLARSDDSPIIAAARVVATTRI